MITINFWNLKKFLLMTYLLPLEINIDVRVNEFFCKINLFIISTCTSYFLTNLLKMHKVFSFFKYILNNLLPTVHINSILLKSFKCLKVHLNDYIHVQSPVVYLLFS